MSDAVNTGLELEPGRAFWRQRRSVSVQELSGFDRNRHRSSKGARATEPFIHSLGEGDLTEDVRLVYEGAKAILGLRRRELVRALAAGGGNVDAPQFQYAVELGCDPADPARAMWQRRVVLLVGPGQLPAEFDRVFPIACDELVVPFVVPPLVSPGMGTSFDLVVDRLEDYAERYGGGVEEDEEAERARLTTRDGSSIALDLGTHELSLRFMGIDGCLGLLVEAQRRFAELADPIVAALA